METHTFERKSLRLILGASADWEALARTCVCFANAQGGLLLIGIEDGAEAPEATQRIPPALRERVFKTVPQLALNVVTSFPELVTASNGGQYLRLEILPSTGIACTSDGRYYVRVSDECKPVYPEALTRLFADKGAHKWELEATDTPVSEADPVQVHILCEHLRASDRVHPQVRVKSDGELLRHYDLVRGDRLTQLGVLWVGRPEHRRRLPHAPSVQFIRFDERGEKAAPKLWFGDDGTLSPLELLQHIEQLEVWREGVEVPSGMFRTFLPNYDLEVVRELVGNALVHRMYTIRGDIFLNLYPDRLEIHSPGPLPVGVTPHNILHQRVRRNERMAALFYALHLMEAEGTGYDKVYRILLSTGKPAPVVYEGADRVTVTVRGRDLSPQTLRVVTSAVEQYRGTDRELTEREVITLGLIARYGPLSANEIGERLALSEAVEMSAWMGRLLERGLVIKTLRGRATRYRVKPDLLREAGYTTRTTLIDIEDHRLRELIRTDIKHYPGSSLSEIRARVGSEIPRTRIQRQLRALHTASVVYMTGKNRWARYFIAAQHEA